MSEILLPKSRIEMVETEVEFILAPFTFKCAFIATLPLPSMTN